MRRAATRGIHGGSLAKRNRARRADLAATHEFVEVYALELALEEPSELLVLRCLLAVWYTDRVGLSIYETNDGRVSLMRIVCHKLGRHDVRSCVAVGQRFE